MASHVQAGSDFFVPLQIRNTSNILWLAGGGSERGMVQVGVKVLDASGEPISEEHGVPPFPQSVAPRRNAESRRSASSPGSNQGLYTVKHRSRDEQDVAWFEEHGLNALTLDLDVI